LKVVNIKKRVLISIVIFLLLCSSIPAIGINTKIKKEDIKTDPDKVFFNSAIKTDTFDFSFSDPDIDESEDDAYVYVDESDFYHIADGEPVLPVKLLTQEYEIGTEIIDLEYEISTVNTISLSKKVSYGKISPRGTDGDEDIYENSELFPSDWVTYHTGGGLSKGEHKTFLSVRMYPVRYNPVEDEIEYISHITITITYEKPDSPLINGDLYDLLIITPSDFKDLLQPLVDHKNNNDVRTKIVDLPEIYDQISIYGRDDAEKIKYYIKQAIENWNIKYVLIVGGIKGQSRSWLMPARYSHVVPPDEQEYAEESFLSDLYFADIFDSKGDFSSWDSNSNNVFAEWTDEKRDEMDIYPDVYVGRLACRYKSEVTTVVDKIISYEKGTGSWFNRFLLVSGDSYPDEAGINEGKMICDKAIDLMPGFNPIKLYADKTNLDINRNTVNNALKQGAGFAYFCGHGNPASWNTHWPPDGTGWCTGYKVFDMLMLFNNDKLPIVVVGGCHNAQFDVTILNLLDDPDSFYYFTWIPECWAWFLTAKRFGGSIATIADTGLGTHGREDTDNNGVPDYLEVLDGWLELNFFKYYSDENIDILGKNHGETITRYMHTYLGSGEKMDTKMVQQWILFGDPSLKIGGT